MLEDIPKGRTGATNAFMTSFTSLDMLICLVAPEHAGDACGILVGNVPIAKPLAIANLGGFLEHVCEGFIPALQ